MAPDSTPSDPESASSRERGGAGAEREKLIGAARTAGRGAHAPYSGYRVGAALEAADGRIFTGCNVENASYPVTLCAERVALGTAVTAGARSFRRLALVVSGEEPASPCGMCRQAMAEFGLGLEVIAEGASGERRTWTLRELLPASFALDFRREDPG